ncbi:hypothetical protein [Leucobacter luti]|uniref:hypothetical protein n=1 Tax=Leucobacter luti TaxID=340320 RepID=UPI00140455D7|nr:hypothetical protein [Leucobacter luti]MCW2287645.1 hypothetical protein [Leucobacter luti]
MRRERELAMLPRLVAEATVLVRAPLFALMQRLLSPLRIHGRIDTIASAPLPGPVTRHR